MNGVGPLVAESPRPHNDPNLVGIQAIDIHQYAQQPPVWSGLEHIESQQTLPPQHVPLPATIQPSPYAQMVCFMVRYSVNTLVF